MQIICISLQRRTEPPSQSTYKEKVVKFDIVVFKICEWTNTQTYSTSQ